MNEQEIRSIVREAIARHSAGTTVESRTVSPVPFTMIRHHPSHALFAVPAGAESGGPCVIEPAVACNHCGYCKSYGH